MGFVLRWLAMFPPALLCSACSDAESGRVCVEPVEPGGHWEWVPGAPQDPRTLVTTWTGEELLAWGEGRLVEVPGGEPEHLRASAYSPATKSWRDITPYGSGQVGLRPGVAWTGSEWIVWGGEAGRVNGKVQTLASGVRLDPATGDWRPMGPAPIEGRFSPMAFWTGKEVLFWAGATADAALADGGAYNPETDTWRRISTEGAPAVPSTRALWTGEVLLFWNVGGEATIATQYDPDVDSWSPISLEGAPNGTRAMAWTGSEMLAWGYDMERGYVAGGAYDPAERTWRDLSTTGAPLAVPNRSTEYPVWSGDRMYVWGDYSCGCRVGGFYDVESDAWSTFTSEGAPTNRYGHHLAWTGQSLLVIGGYGGHEGRFAQVDGGEFFPDP